MKSLERRQNCWPINQTEDKSAQSENDQKITQLEKQLADAKVDLQKKLDNPVGNKPIFAIIPIKEPTARIVARSISNATIKALRFSPKES